MIKDHKFRKQLQKKKEGRIGLIECQTNMNNLAPYVYKYWDFFENYMKDYEEKVKMHKS